MAANASRIRIEDLPVFEQLTGKQMEEIVGAGFRRRPVFTQYAAEVLEVRQMMSGVTFTVDATQLPGIESSNEQLVPEQLIPAVISLVQKIQQESNALGGSVQNLDLLGKSAQEQLTKAISENLNGIHSQSKAGDLKSAGLSVISHASLSEIDAFLTSGSAASQDLILLRLTRGADRQIVLTASGQDQITIDDRQIDAAFDGQLQGTLNLGLDLVFGLDAQGRGFVREGSKIDTELNASGQIQAEGMANSNVQVKVQADGQTAFENSLTVDDGDAILEERIYLDSNHDFSEFIKFDSTMADIDFGNVSAELSVKGMADPIRLRGTAEWDEANQAGEFDLDETAIIDAFAELVDKGLDELADHAHELATRISDVPVVGDEIEAQLTQRIDEFLDVDLPAEGTRKYLQDRGFTIDQVVTLEQLLTGQYTDLVVITWNRHELGNAISTTAEGQFGKQGGISLDVAGNLTIQPEYNLNMTFGLDTLGGLFIQEGSSVSVSLIADGTVEGSAKIPNLVNVHVFATAPEGEHLIDASLELMVDDQDSIHNERLYLADLQADIVEVLVDADIKVDAEMSVDSPVNQLPAFIRPALSGLLPDKITWTAGATYDLKDDVFTYDINSTSLTEIVEAFQGADGIEDALKNFMLNRLAENNPLPESTQKFLGTKIPLLEANVMDLLEIPQGLQYVIAPLAFLNQSVPEVPHDKLEFRLDLFNTDNIRRMLSGETYDIVSLDIDQRFEKKLGEMTVMPETLVASYFGIINATVEITLSPGFFLDIDMITGIDSKSFYIVGDMNGGAGDKVEPNFKIGGSLTANIIGEGDLLFVVDLARITGMIGVRAYGDFTFVSPHEGDPKLRIEDINPDQIAVGLGVDATLQLKGEIGLVKFDQYDRDYLSPEKVIPIYRHHDGTTLGDLQDRIQEFQKRLKEEGRTAIFIGAAATHDPHLVAAAVSIIYQESGMGEVARTLVVDFKMRVDEAARAMKEAGADIGEIATHLWSHCENDLNKFATALKAAGAEFDEIANQVWDKANNDHIKFVQALQSVGAELGEIATQVWNRANGDALQFAKSLKSVGASVNEIASELWNESRIKGDLNKLGKALQAAGASVDELATELWSRAENDLNKLAKGLQAADVHIGEIATQVWNRAGGNVKKLIKAIKAVDRQLGSLVGGIWTSLANLQKKVQGQVNQLQKQISRLAQQFGKQVLSAAKQRDLILNELNAVSSQLGKLWDTASPQLRGLTQNLSNSAQTKINEATKLRNTTVADLGRQMEEAKIQAENDLKAIGVDLSAIGFGLSGRMSLGSGSGFPTTINDVKNSVGDLYNEAKAEISTINDQIQELVKDPLNNTARIEEIRIWLSEKLNGLNNQIRDAESAATRSIDAAKNAYGLQAFQQAGASARAVYGQKVSALEKAILIKRDQLATQLSNARDHLKQLNPSQVAVNQWVQQILSGLNQTDASTSLQNLRLGEFQANNPNSAAEVGRAEFQQEIKNILGTHAESQRPASSSMLVDIGVLSLRTYNGNYLRANFSLDGRLDANPTDVRAWEIFTVEDRGNNQVALRAANGKYLCAEGAGGSVLNANREHVAAWELFWVERRGNNEIALMTSNGYYLTAINGGGGEVLADRTVASSWETFRIVEEPRQRNAATERTLAASGIISIRTSNGSLVSGEGTGAVIANRSAVGVWEKFEIITADDGRYILKSGSGRYLARSGEQIISTTSINNAEKFFVIGLGGNSFALRASNGLYVAAEDGGGRELVANRDWAREWETFQFADQTHSLSTERFTGTGLLNLVSTRGNLLSAESGGGREVVANRTLRGAWEDFRVVNLGGGYVAIQAANGMYFSAEGGGGGAVVADRTAIGEWERFKVIGLDGDKVALRTSKGFYLTVVSGGGGAVRADAQSIGGNETLGFITEPSNRDRTAESRFKTIGRVQLRVSNGQWISAESGGGSEIVSNRSSAGEWEQFDVVRLGDQVALRSRNGQYLTVSNGRLMATAGSAGTWERFEVVGLGGDQIALRSANGHYVTAEGGGGGQLNVDRRVPVAWETFRFFATGDLTTAARFIRTVNVSLQANNGLYVAAEGGGGGVLNANRTGVGAWERFTVVSLGGDQVALRTSNGKYLCANGGGGSTLSADRTGIGAWETFTVVSVGNGIALRTSNGHYLCAEGGGGRELVANRQTVGAWETFRFAGV